MWSVKRQNATRLAEYLSAHSKVLEVRHLSLLTPDDPAFDIYKRQCRGPGAMISFVIDGGEPEVFRFLDAMELTQLTVSLGGTESLASHPWSTTHSTVSPCGQIGDGYRRGFGALLRWHRRPGRPDCRSRAGPRNCLTRLGRCTHTRPLSARDRLWIAGRAGRRDRGSCVWTRRWCSDLQTESVPRRATRCPPFLVRPNAVDGVRLSRMNRCNRCSLPGAERAA